MEQSLFTEAIVDGWIRLARSQSICPSCKSEARSSKEVGVLGPTLAEASHAHASSHRSVSVIGFYVGKLFSFVLVQGLKREGNSIFQTQTPLSSSTVTPSITPFQANVTGVIISHKAFAVGTFGGKIWLRA